MSETEGIRRVLVRPGLRILDLRPHEDFVAGHLAGAVHHALTGPVDPVLLEAELPSIFLPPREIPLLVVANDPVQALAAAEHLQGRGRAPVTGQALAAEDLAGLPPEMVASGAGHGHLWSPPAWLEGHEGLLPPPAAGPVLDLACGSGRAAVWLAERGYRVTGLDWQAEALDMGRRLAASRGVSCDFKAADLRREASVPTGPWSVLLNFRYLDRTLLASFARLVRPTGVVLLRTFREAPGYEGHPRPRHRLGPWELTGAFARGEWEILAHEQGFDPDGRPAAGIVARRRP